jgi:hypothetical protein
MLSNTITYIIISSILVSSILYSFYYFSTKKDILPQWIGFVWMACLVAYIVVIMFSFR